MVRTRNQESLFETERERIARIQLPRITSPVHGGHGGRNNSGSGNNSPLRGIVVGATTTTTLSSSFGLTTNQQFLNNNNNENILITDIPDLMSGNSQESVNEQIIIDEQQQQHPNIFHNFLHNNNNNSTSTPPHPRPITSTTTTNIITTTTTTKEPAKKKTRLLFSPNPPIEHEFVLQSPPARLLPRQKGACKQLDEARIRLDLEERGLSTPQKIGQQERQHAEQMWKIDLINELKQFHGIEASVDDFSHDDLVEMLELARTLRRRAELRTFFQTLPSEMPLVKLQAELMSRRINVMGLTHSRASEALENALIKEDVAGLIGDGYQFGRKVVSVRDVLAFENPSDKNLRDILKSKQVQKIPMKKLDKLEMVRSIVEHETESALRVLINKELDRELERRGLLLVHNLADDNTDNDSSPSSTSSSSLTYATSTITSTNTNELDFNTKFHRLFAARVWRKDYSDISNVSLPESVLTKFCERGSSHTTLPSSFTDGDDKNRCIVS
jgi:hypothetical protein